MKHENIRRIWLAFISKYQQRFLDNEAQWANTLDNNQKYIDGNNKRPLQYNKNKEINVLGSWLSNQQNKYKKKEHVMKHEEVYNTYTELLAEYQECFLIMKHNGIIF